MRFDCERCGARGSGRGDDGWTTGLPEGWSFENVRGSLIAKRLCERCVRFTKAEKERMRRKKRRPEVGASGRGVG